MFQGHTHRAVRFLATLQVGDDLPGGGTVGICGGREIGREKRGRGGGGGEGGVGERESG